MVFTPPHTLRTLAHTLQTHIHIQIHALHTTPHTRRTLSTVCECDRNDVRAEIFGLTSFSTTTETPVSGSVMVSPTSHARLQPESTPRAPPAAATSSTHSDSGRNDRITGER